MKRNFWFVLLVPLFFSGCGNIEWFPDNSAVFRNTSTTIVTNTVTAPSPPSLIKSFSPAAILAGTNSALTFTIINGTGTPARSGLGFTDTLPTGLTVVAPPASLCGGTVSSSGSAITFTGGTLAAGPTNCTITATVTAAAASFPNKTADLTGTTTGLAGGLESAVTTQALSVFPTSIKDSTGDVTAANLLVVGTNSNPPNVDYTLQVDASNSNPLTDANVTVAVIAVDVTGAAIASTATNISGTVPSNTPTPTFLGLGSPTLPVPATDAAKILFWRIVSVTVQ